MCSSNFIRFPLILVLALAFLPGCRTGGDGTADTGPVVTAADDRLNTGIPFVSKEPEAYTAEITVTAGGVSRTTFIARNGTDRRYDFNFGSKDQLISLRTDREILVFPEGRVYTEVDAAPMGTAESWTDAVTAERLGENHAAAFEKLETVGSVTGYRVRLEGSTFSEAVIYFDESVSMPVKQEFYSTEGDRRSLDYLVEVRNLKLEAAADLFLVPKDFKKVTPAEFRSVVGARSAGW